MWFIKTWALDREVCASGDKLEQASLRQPSSREKITASHHRTLKKVRVAFSEYEIRSTKGELYLLIYLFIYQCSNLIICLFIYMVI